MKTRLSIEEREQIHYYLGQKKTCREIALLLNRSHTTISREIKRNRFEDVYLPTKANEAFRQRYKQCGRRSKIDNNIKLFDEVFNKIFQKWSPECQATSEFDPLATVKIDPLTSFYSL